MGLAAESEEKVPKWSTQTSRIPKGEAPPAPGSSQEECKGFLRNKLRRTKEKPTQRSWRSQSCYSVSKSTAFPQVSNTQGQGGRRKLSTRGIPS